MRGADNIGDRIPRAHFVERYGVRRDAVHPALGLGEQSEDRDRPLLDRRRQVRGFQVGAYVAERDMAARHIGQIDHEAGPGHGPVVMGANVEGDIVRRTDHSQGRHQAVAQLGARVEHRGDKHVAGNAANRVEMRVQSHGPTPYRIVRAATQ